MMVIPEVCRANLLTLSVPDEGYSRSVSCQSFDFAQSQKIGTTHFWNNHHQVHSKSKDWHDTLLE
jgi:hypothetical protein